MKISREAYIRRLRELGFRYRRQTDRTTVWRRAYDVLEVYVPRKRLVMAEHVQANLARAGESPEAIRQFIAACNN